MSYVLPEGKYDDVFIHKTLTKIEGKPTYATLKENYKKLRANAHSIDSDLGGGEHGHLGVMMSAADYTELTGNQWTEPVYPGGKPTIPAGTLPAEKGYLCKMHQIEMDEWRACHYIKKALRKQILQAIDKEYYADLINKTTGIVDMSPYDIMEHLMSKYGKITQLDIEKNNAIMLKPYDPNEPISKLFNQIEDCVEFAKDAKNELTETAIVGRAYHLMVQTGEYQIATTIWKNKPEAEQTWDNFKDYFAEEYITYCETKESMNSNNGLTIKDSTYSNSNDDSYGYNSQANIANDSTANEEIDQTYLNEANSILAAYQANVASNNDNNSVSQSDLKAMFDKLNEKLEEMSNTSNNGNNNGKNKGKNAGKGKKDKNRLYCWTHGACNHKGSDCNNKSEGHKDEATVHNMMNGSTKNCWWIKNDSA